MYALCKTMEWAHLPVAGGVYDQHPRFIDHMWELMQIEGKVEADKAREDKRKAATRRR